jgi:hypothetical protein
VRNYLFENKYFGILLFYKKVYKGDKTFYNECILNGFEDFLGVLFFELLIILKLLDDYDIDFLNVIFNFGN